MNFDIKTLAFIQGLISITHLVAVFTQYKINKTYRGITWWVLGSLLMAVGTVFMPLVQVKSLIILAMIANPFVVLGQIFLYIGIMQFLDKKENKWMSIIIFIIFIIFYYYFMFFDNDISSRTIILTATSGIIFIMTAHNLFLNKNSDHVVSANFTATVFYVYGFLNLVRCIATIFSSPINSYDDSRGMLVASFIVPIIASTLWTFGLIIMINQRLNVENRMEKEKIYQIFDTIPDAAIITRLQDGLFVDVNEGFLAMTGYARDEIIEQSTININLWDNIEDRNTLAMELNKNGKINNKESVFNRKNGSQFVGEISASILTIGDIHHVVSTIHDITDRKQAEQKIQELIRQLEIERNTAEQKSITDALTGVANRRYFDEAFKKEFNRLKRSGAIMSLIMLDVDYFKKYNDNYGHLAGDDCLKRIGSMLNSIVHRVPDVVARYGGEEFVIMLPETEENGAIKIAKQIQNQLKELAITHAASDVGENVTVSIGVVTVCTTGFETLEQVVTLADEAMYRAKNNGRNRIEVKTDNPKK